MADVGFRFQTITRGRSAGLATINVAFPDIGEPDLPGGRCDPEAIREKAIRLLQDSLRELQRPLPPAR